MKQIIQQLQDFYKINCNGEWEHENRISIFTTDNPSWIIKIDLKDTFLDRINFNKDFRNNEFDFYNIEIKNSVLEIHCGIENLEHSFNIFFNEIIPKFKNEELYEIYLPIDNFREKLWTYAEGIIVDEETIQLIKIPEINSSNLRFKATNIETNNQKLTTKYKINQLVKIKLEKTVGGIILTAK